MEMIQGLELPSLANYSPLDQLLERIQSDYQHQKHSLNYLVQRSLDNAWNEYGPNNPRKLAFKKSQQMNHRRSVAGGNEQEPILLSKNFQPLTSEWESLMVPLPATVKQPMKPGLFNRLLSIYIDFEVNNHETADFLRRFFFFLLAGLIALGWIFLGFFIVI